MSNEDQIKAGYESENEGDWKTVPIIGNFKRNRKVIQVEKRAAVKRLENCKIVNTEYTSKLLDAELVQEMNATSVKVIVKDEKELDLKFDREQMSIQCHPNHPGEVEFTLVIDVVKRERHIFPYVFTVNPDPKTLWKNIPTDQKIIFYKDDACSIEIDAFENKKIIGASVRGRSHANDGRPRDDHFEFKYLNEFQCAIMVVADGAGSAKYSRKGSKIVSEFIVEKFEKTITSEYKSEMDKKIEMFKLGDSKYEKDILAEMWKLLVYPAWEAKDEIRKFINESDENYVMRDFATTLITTIVFHNEQYGFFIANFWVGDGGMGIICHAKNEVIVLGKADSGPFGGQTRFLTEDSVEVWPRRDDQSLDHVKLLEDRVKFVVVNEFDAIVLMTDGVTDPIFETDVNLNDYKIWEKMLTELESSVVNKEERSDRCDALLKWLEFWKQGNHDDRTLIILK